MSNRDISSFSPVVLQPTLNQFVQHGRGAFLAQFKRCQPPLSSQELLTATSAEEAKLSRKELNQFLESLPPLEEATQHQPARFDSSLSIGFPTDLFARPQWNSVAIFFNLGDAVSKPGDYQPTTAQDVRNWMDEGENPSNPTIKEFVFRYWQTLSYNQLRFSIEVPRDRAGVPPDCLTDLDKLLRNQG